MNEQLRAMLRKTEGKFFSVRFIKKDGSERKMTCRIGVSKHVTGEGLKFDPAEKGLLGVWDTTKRQYRFINLKTLLDFRCGKMSWRKA